MPRITKRVVDALRPQERERVVWDDEIKGFGVRVHPTGRETADDDRPGFAAGRQAGENPSVAPDRRRARNRAFRRG